MIVPYSTADRSSFAYKTVKGFEFRKSGLTLDRWPILLTKVIADVEETIKAGDTAGLRSEGDKIIRELIALKEDMERDRPLKSILLFSNTDFRLILDDKLPNVMVYNEELRRMNRPTWRNVSWLYSECYLYTSATPPSELIF